MAMYGSKAAVGDTAADEAFVASLALLRAPAKGTIRLLDRGDYYSAHGHDALYLATEVFNTRTVLKTQLNLPYLTLTPTIAQSFLRDALTVKQLRVEIYATPSGTPNKWFLDKVASPGNLQQLEQLLFANHNLLASPVILALFLSVKDGVKNVGVCFADTSAMRMGVSEFVDNDLFSNTESLLIQLGVKEVILPADEKSTDYDLNKIRTVIERCAIVVSDRKRSSFNAKDVEQDLNRLLSTELMVSTLPEFDLKIAMASTAALVSYLSLMNDTSNHNSYTLETHDLSQYMKLDASALRALNLMPDATGMGGSNKNMSLYGLLNQCKTAQGMRLLNRWLKQPLVNLHEIERRQDLVQCMVDDQATRRAIQDEKLKAMPDLHRISKRFQKGVANLEDVVRVYQCIRQLPGLIATLEAGGEGDAEVGALIEDVWLSKIRDHNEKLQQLHEMVETTIDLDEIDRHNYIIKPEFDEELQELKGQLETMRDELDTEHATVAEDLGMETDNKTLHFEQSPMGYTFRLTKKEGVAIQNKSRYIVLQSKANGIQFTTKKLKTLNDDYKSLNADYDKKQRSLVKEVINIAATFAPVLELLNDVLAHLDVIVSFATASVNAPIPYVKPVVSERGATAMELVDSRHPCLEVQDGINFIPNDVSFERDVDEFHVITGANMGGKSTFIRQVGVIALMAQIGCFVPCASAKLSVFDSILCRVGAGDSQLKGVSTFMAEMLETAAILRSATKDSLIIIDELGRGTSTYDGFGLAWAISEHIATEIKAFCLFATHFHELTALAQQISSVKNYHVMAHVEVKEDSLTGKEITFLYQIQPGVCDQSFGIHVAELANFPEEVIRLAKRKADDLEDFTEKPTEATISSNLSPESIAAGTGLVERFLATWAASSLSLANGTVDGDTEMDGGSTQQELELAAELDLLKKTMGEFEGELAASEWVSQVLSVTY